MPEIIFAPTFFRQAKRLPETVKSILKEQILRLADNPRDPRLHVKPLQGKFSGQWSFRVTRDYRVLFTIDHASKTVYILLTIDDRKNVYR